MALLSLLALLPSGAAAWGERVEAKVWRPSAENFVFPELEETGLVDFLAGKDFGVALAGGGMRGLALGQGTLRVLREVGLLEKAKYLSVTSGSVWLGLPLYYQTLDSLDTYLGKTLQPEEMLPEALLAETGTAISRLLYLQEYPKGHGPKERRLSNQSRSFFDCPADEGWCACMVERFQPGSAYSLYPLFIAYIFLHPFELAGHGSTHCHETQLDRLKAKLGSSRTIYTAKDQSQKLPFLLSQSAVLAPYSGLEPKDPLEFFPLEQTPLYMGTVPTSHSSAGMHAVGDVLVEPFAWDSTIRSPWQNQSGQEQSIEVSRALLNVGDLALWAGTATAYIADFQVRPWADKLPRCIIAEGEKVLPHARLWSPSELDADSVPLTHEEAVGDAGVYDDLGHIPLLRRNISKIALFTSGAIHGDLCEMTYVLAAFGQPGCLTPPNPPGASNPKMKAGALTVFEPSEFAPFWAQIEEAFHANESAVIRGRYTVVENKQLGIRGGWKVDMVWTIFLPSKTFRGSLPSKSNEMLPWWFPNDLASEMTSKLEMSAASQFAAWLAHRSVVKEIKEMLAASSPLAETALVI
ncbi:unnamed protein product [Effrenium voratum]|nr:unnamed protein product [Effrenium voratum]